MPEEEKLTKSIVKRWGKQDRTLKTQPEAPYNNYGERGYADLHLRTQDGNGIFDLVMEVKANLQNYQASQVIRQVTKMIENFYDGSRSKPDSVRFELCIFPTKQNFQHLKDNYELYKNLYSSYSRLNITFRSPKNTTPTHLFTYSFDFCDDEWVTHLKLNDENYCSIQGVIQNE